MLCLLEFVRQHARHPEDRVRLEPWRLHITRLRSTAQAMIFLGQRQYQDAWQTARDAGGFSGRVDDGLPEEEKLAAALRESIREALAVQPVLSANEEAAFLRQDDFWTIRYHGHTAFLKSARGLECLACLLHSPGREFHVSELLASISETREVTRAGPAGEGRCGDGEHFVTKGFYDGGPLLDGQAKVECKRRLDDLRQELADAEQCNDSERAAKAHDEINAIARHLASAVGLGGRDRKTSSEAERARCAVTKRIKQAIQKINDAIPALGHHLTARIKTGYFCSYNPHPDHPVAWKF
jgi:hypothetical protein